MDIPCCYMQREGRGEGEGANHRRSPTGARSPFCPHTPLAETTREREREREEGEEVSVRKDENSQIVRF